MEGKLQSLGDKWEQRFEANQVEWKDQRTRVCMSDLLVNMELMKQDLAQQERLVKEQSVPIAGQREADNFQVTYSDNIRKE